MRPDDGRSARIFSDRNTNEVYIDGGLEYRTYRREPSQTGSSETKIGSVTAIKSLKVFQLKSIWKAAAATEDTAEAASDSKPISFLPPRNIRRDKEESKNIASEHPEIVKRLATEFQDAVESLRSGESYN
ncbi:hypothetical protein NZK35_25425 [Stieleria sp. ICT_E10.1]|uniref:hypothetical protein n=1 Tax=Stieleria sedimenti TaxID=2976331 RepID=UPI0021804872|nr:hypothetical protein [Stieleria sedimenti]MCS7470003.1 hypothetical protein [Stieleria sedimenti]